MAQNPFAVIAGLEDEESTPSVATPQPERNLQRAQFEGKWYIFDATGKDNDEAAAEFVTGKIPPIRKYNSQEAMDAEYQKMVGESQPRNEAAPTESAPLSFEEQYKQKRQAMLGSALSKKKEPGIIDQAMAMGRAAAMMYRLTNLEKESSNLSYELMEGMITPQGKKRLKFLTEQTEKIAESIKDDPLVARSIGQIAPWMVNSIEKGAAGYMKGALVFGVGTAIASAIGGPVTGGGTIAATPITVPAAMAIGGKIGATFDVLEDMRKPEAGSHYAEMRKAGISHEVARTFAHTYSLGAVGLESAQLGILSKMIPGGSKVIDSVVGNAIHEFVGKIASNRVGKILGVHAAGSVAEGTIEGAQQTYQNFLSILAKHYNDYAKETKLAPETAEAYWKELKEGVAESFYETAIGVGVIGAPVAGSRAMRRERKPSASKEEKARDIDEEIRNLFEGNQDKIDEEGERDQSAEFYRQQYEDAQVKPIPSTDLRSEVAQKKSQFMSDIEKMEEEDAADYNRVKERMAKYREDELTMQFAGLAADEHRKAVEGDIGRSIPGADERWTPGQVPAVATPPDFIGQQGGPAISPRAEEDKAIRQRQMEAQQGVPPRLPTPPQTDPYMLPVPVGINVDRFGQPSGPNAPGGQFLPQGSVSEEQRRVMTPAQYEDFRGGMGAPATRMPQDPQAAYDAAQRQLFGGGEPLVAPAYPPDMDPTGPPSPQDRTSPPVATQVSPQGRSSIVAPPVAETPAPVAVQTPGVAPAPQLRGVQPTQGVAPAPQLRGVVEESEAVGKTDDTLLPGTGPVFIKDLNEVKGLNKQLRKVGVVLSDGTVVEGETVPPWSPSRKDPKSSEVRATALQNVMRKAERVAKEKTAQLKKDGVDTPVRVKKYADSSTITEENQVPGTVPAVGYVLPAMEGTNNRPVFIPMVQLVNQTDYDSKISDNAYSKRQDLATKVEAEKKTEEKQKVKEKSQAERAAPILERNKALYTGKKRVQIVSAFRGRFPGVSADIIESALNGAIQNAAMADSVLKLHTPEAQDKQFKSAIYYEMKKVLYEDLHGTRRNAEKAMKTGVGRTSSMDTAKQGKDGEGTQLISQLDSEGNLPESTTKKLEKTVVPETVRPAGYTKVVSGEAAQAYAKAKGIATSKSLTESQRGSIEDRKKWAAYNKAVAKREALFKEGRAVEAEKVVIPPKPTTKVAKATPKAAPAIPAQAAEMLKELDKVVPGKEQVKQILEEEAKAKESKQQERRSQEYVARTKKEVDGMKNLSLPQSLRNLVHKFKLAGKMVLDNTGEVKSFKMFASAVKEAKKQGGAVIPWGDGYIVATTSAGRVEFDLKATRADEQARLDELKKNATPSSPEAVAKAKEGKAKRRKMIEAKGEPAIVENAPLSESEVKSMGSMTEAEFKTTHANKILSLIKQANDIMGEKGQIGGLEEGKIKQLKPIFDEMWKEAQAMGQDVKTFVREVVKQLGESVAPYFRNWIANDFASQTRVAAPKTQGKTEPVVISYPKSTEKEPTVPYLKTPDKVGGTVSGPGSVQDTIEAQRQKDIKAAFEDDSVREKRKEITRATRAIHQREAETLSYPDANRSSTSMLTEIDVGSAVKASRKSAFEAVMVSETGLTEERISTDYPERKTEFLRTVRDTMREKKYTKVVVTESAVKGNKPSLAHRVWKVFIASFHKTIANLDSPKGSWTIFEKDPSTNTVNEKVRAASEPGFIKDGFLSAVADIGEAGDKAAKFFDVEHYWKKSGLPQIGYAIKNWFGRRSVEEQRGKEKVAELADKIRKDFAGKVTASDLANITLSAEDNAHFVGMPREWQARAKDSVTWLRKYFEDAKTEFAARDLHLDFKGRMLSKWQQKIDKAKTKGKDELAAKYQAMYDEIDQNFEFVHIPYQMMLDQRLRAMEDIQDKVVREKSARQLKSMLSHLRRSPTLKTLITPDKDGNSEFVLSDINPYEIIMNYSYNKGFDHAMLDIRDAALQYVDDKGKPHLVKVSKARPEDDAKHFWVSVDRTTDVFNTVLTDADKMANKKVWLRSDLAQGLQENVAYTEHRGVWQKATAVVKASWFTNPFVMPMYNLVQMGQGGVLITEALRTSLGKTVKDVGGWKAFLAPKGQAKMSEDFQKAFGKLGLGGDISNNPFRSEASFAEYMKQESMADDTSYISSTARMIWHAYWDHIKRNPKTSAMTLGMNSVTKLVYNAINHITWTLEGATRMLMYNHLLKQGQAEQFAASHVNETLGDYASVPAATRQTLNKFLFTPTYKIAVTKFMYGVLKENAKIMASSEGRSNILPAILGSRLYEGKQDQINKQRRRMLYSGFGTVASMLVLQGLAKSLDWEEDEFLRKWHININTPDGPKELNFTFSSPINLHTKFARKIYRTLVPEQGDIRPFNKRAFDAMKFELTPLITAMYNAVQNVNQDGRKIVHPYDDDTTAIRKYAMYAIDTAAKFWKDMRQSVYQEEQGRSRQLASEYFDKEYGPWADSLIDLAFYTYTSDIPKKKIANKVKQLGSSFKQDQKEYVRQYGKPNEDWVRNYQKKRQELMDLFRERAK